jgi:hypothetical protein
MPANQPTPPATGKAKRKRGQRTFFLDGCTNPAIGCLTITCWHRDTEWHDRRESQFLLILITLFSAEIIALLLSLPTMITGSFWNVFAGPK